jgi:hypothetical protein
VLQIHARDRSSFSAFFTAKAPSSQRKEKIFALFACFAVQALLLILLIAYSASAAIVSDGLRPGLAGLIEPAIDQPDD